MTIHTRYVSKRGHRDGFYYTIISIISAATLSPYNFRDTSTTCILTHAINCQLSQGRVATALGKFRAVPHQQLLALLKRFDGVEVDVQTALACNQVLVLHGTGWVDVAHPVAPLLVQTVQDVV